MIKVLKVMLPVLLLSLPASTVLAQTQNPDGNKRPLPPDGQNTQPYTQKEEPTNDPANKSGIGSRALSPGEGNTPAPDTKGTPDLKKLDTQGRGGQQN